MEIIRHSFYCNLYKNAKWKSLEISNDFALSKGAEIPGTSVSESSWHYRGEHIIDVLKHKTFIKELLEDVESFLLMAVNVYENKSPSIEFGKLFDVVQGQKTVDEVTIAIAHTFI